MTLRGRVLTQVGVFLGAAFALLALFTHGGHVRHRRLLERDRALVSVRTALDRLDGALRETEAFVLAWRRCPDAGQALDPAARNAPKALEDLARDAGRLGLYALALVNTNGQVVAGYGACFSGDKLAPLPGSVRAHLSPRSPLFSASGETAAATRGVLLLPEGPMGVVAVPLSCSEASPGPCGFIVAGIRLWPGTDTGHGSPRLAKDITIERIEEAWHLEPHAWLDVGGSTNRIPVHLEVCGERILKAWAIVEDIYGQPAIRVGVTPAVSDLAGRSRSVAVCKLLGIILALATGSALLVLLDRRLLTPLTRLTHGIRTSRQRGGETHVSLSGQGDVAEVAREVNALLDAWKAKQQALAASHRAWKVTAACTEALLKVRDELPMVQEVCRLLVDLGGYRFVWIGYAEHDAARSVRPVAQAGHGKGYLEAIRLSWGDNEYGRGPTGRAIRSHEPVVCRHIGTDPAFAPWRAEAQRRGYESSLAVPLVFENVALGTLNLYSGQPDAFTPEEVEWLRKLADHVAHAIATRRRGASS